MKTKKHINLLWEGFESALDLSGVGFRRSRKHNSIGKSWYNVGSYFTSGFEIAKSSRSERHDIEGDYLDSDKLQLQ